MTMYGSHAYCLMGPTSNAEFCPVCRHYMNQEFEYLDNPDTENPRSDDNHVENPDTHNPPPPPPTGVRIIRAAFVQDPTKVVPPAASAQDPKRVPPAASTQDPKRVVPPPIPLLAPGATGPIVRLIVSIDPANGQIVAAKKAFPINARYAPSHHGSGALKPLPHARLPRRRSFDIGCARRRCDDPDARRHRRHGEGYQQQFVDQGLVAGPGCDREADHADHVDEIDTRETGRPTRATDGGADQGRAVGFLVYYARLHDTFRA